MICLWISALLFGLVHPGSKLILESGVRLDIFCFCYIGVRLIIQLPAVVINKSFEINNSKQLLCLLALGLVGALLQFTEFAGISMGMEVSTVTFLVYTHPFWGIVITTVLSKKISNNHLLKTFFALLGILIIFSNADLTNISYRKFMYPISAGFFIACWIKLSGEASKLNLKPLTISFYYDLFAALSIITYSNLILKNDLISESINFMSEPRLLILMVVYSSIVGLLPNILFYKASGIVDSLTAGYALLIEPVIATIISFLIWDEKLTLFFLIGATFVLIANIPNELWKKIRFKFLSSIAILALISFNEAYSSEIVLFEIIPTENNDYTSSLELKHISMSADLAIKHASKEYHQCMPKITKTLKFGSESDLIKEILKIKNSPVTLVGLTRSNFARSAAGASKGGALKAISTGAAANNLATINSNFMTIINPVEVQYELIKENIVKSCRPNRTAAVFDSSQYLSKYFKDNYEKDSFGRIEKEKLENPNLACAFIGLNFSEALKHLNSLSKSKQKLTIFGTGDWNFHEKELDQLLKSMNNNITLVIPTGWNPSENVKTERFVKDFTQLAGEQPGAVAAYTYEGVWLAIDSICNKYLPIDVNLRKVFFLRSFTGKTAGGNLTSKMHLKSLKGKYNGTL